MFKKKNLESLEYFLDGLIYREDLSNELKTLIIKIDKEKPEQLTEAELTLLEEESEIFMDKYQKCLDLLYTSEELSNIKSLYED